MQANYIIHHSFILFCFFAQANLENNTQNDDTQNQAHLKYDMINDIRYIHNT